MIIYDFSSALHQNVHNIDKLGVKITKDKLRIRLIDSILYINKKFKDEYGPEFVIALDDTSWRKSVFPNYKNNRKEKRKEDKFDWNEIHKFYNEILEEIKENFPYKVIKVSGAEGDDVVAVLAKHVKGNTIVIGPDKDYSQLHRLPSIKQFAPIKNDFLNFEKSEIPYILFSHVCRGDASDGIPSILNDKNCFVNGIRQKPLKETYIAEAFENAKSGKLEEFLGSEKFKRFEENKTLIDFRCIPDNISSEIISQYENFNTSQNNAYKYFIQNDLIDIFLKDIQNF